MGEYMNTYTFLKDIFGTKYRAKKPNFPECFRADNGKNRNMPERNLSKQTIK